MKRLSVVILLVILPMASFLVATDARADFISFDITTPNSGIQAYSGPYASILVNLTSANTAQITVKSLNGYFFGDGSSVALNTNGRVIVSNISGMPDYKSWSNKADQQVSVFGGFNLTIDNKGGYGNRFSSVTFNLTDTSGTWASASDVLVKNAAGYMAADHIFVNNGLSGYAGGVATPIPGAVLLFAPGLIGIVALRKRFTN